MVKNLDVQIKGVVPKSLLEQGDAIFERSRFKPSDNRSSFLAARREHGDELFHGFFD